MTTTHRVLFRSSAGIDGEADESVDLIVTSPPYPMIGMWDPLFAAADPRISVLLDEGKGEEAFDLMHRQLEPVWRGCFRALKPGGFLCLNIGDATRRLGASFRLYTNQARLTWFCESIGFASLPPVIWRKQTNAPTKFMGSGMLPGGAYVTLEHEYVLIFRKGERRAFPERERNRRRESALFWEERNLWFSDVWEIKGSRQVVGTAARERSGAFPLELANRLVLMYSLQGDTVLDPFLGTGTTAAACALNGRCSVGYEISDSLEPAVRAAFAGALSMGESYAAGRLDRHRAAMEELARKGRPPRHVNDRYGFPVMTSQETDLRIPVLENVTFAGEPFAVAEHGWL